ncbi:MAG: protein translocase subunit SecF, partial [Rudaea sp.]
MEVFNPNSNIDFLRLRKISITISVLLVIIAIGAIFGRGLNYGLDFTGGVLVEVQYDQPVDVAEVRAALTEANYPNALVQSVGGVREVSVRIQPSADDAGALKKSDVVAAEVMKALTSKRADAKMTRPPDFVGPQVGEELKSDGIIAVLFVIIGIMIYIGIRFEWRFAVAAIASEI